MNLDAYLERIAYAGELTPSDRTLEALHLAHATHVPFENLDILLGRPIRLDLDSLEQKLVRDRRGGYCFEQNLLFATVLEQLGFTVRRLLARVRYRTSAILPRTHMVLLVDVGEQQWIADVGFGGEGLLLPVPFGDGEPSRQYRWSYRVVPEFNHHWTMQSYRVGEWIDMYGFTLERQELVDYEVANHYTSTHPSSRFVQSLTVQRPGPDARLILRNRELTTDLGDTISTRLVADQDELLHVLDECFGLRFPAGTRFKIAST